MIPHSDIQYLRLSRREMPLLLNANYFNPQLFTNVQCRQFPAPAALFCRMTCITSSFAICQLKAEPVQTPQTEASWDPRG